MKCYLFFANALKLAMSSLMCFRSGVPTRGADGAWNLRSWSAGGRGLGNGSAGG